jgi:hypothetical protein
MTYTGDAIDDTRFNKQKQYFLCRRPLVQNDVKFLPASPINCLT